MGPDLAFRLHRQRVVELALRGDAEGAMDGSGDGRIVGVAVVGEGDGSGVGSIEGMNVTVGPGLGARDGGTVGTLVVGAALGSDVVG